MQPQHRVILLLTLCLLAFSLTGEPVAESAASSPDHSGGVPSIIIYNFYPAQEDFPAKYNYLADTIPDIIREQLLADNAFYLVEKEKVKEAARAAGSTGNSWHRDGSLRLRIAGSLAGDYFAWGYFVIEEQRLLIFFQLVETVSARTIHIEKGEFPLGFELFDEVDLAAKGFSRWINKTLPQKIQTAPEEQAATTQPSPDLAVTQPSLLTPAAEEPPGTDFSLEFCGQYHFYLPPFSRYLEPSPGVRFNFTMRNRESSSFFYGLSLLVTLLSQPAIGAQPAANNIKILFLPFLAKAGFAFEFVSNFALELSLDLGPALFFGYLEPEVVAYFRFSIGPEILVSWTPVPSFKLSAGLGGLLTPYSYSDWLMISLAPQLLLAFTF